MLIVCVRARVRVSYEVNSNWSWLPQINQHHWSANISPPPPLSSAVSHLLIRVSSCWSQFDFHKLGFCTLCVSRFSFDFFFIFKWFSLIFSSARVKVNQWDEAVDFFWPVDWLPQFPSLCLWEFVQLNDAKAASTDFRFQFLSLSQN